MLYGHHWVATNNTKFIQFRTFTPPKDLIPFTFKNINNYCRCVDRPTEATEATEADIFRLSSEQS